jgi:A/G-specific adenine glycosylase
VFARIYNIEENILSAKVKKEITELVKARQDAERPGDFNEALMDLGATVCIPGQPRCEVCPLAAVCMARAAGKETEIPLRITKKEVPVEHLTVFVVKAAGSCHGVLDTDGEKQQRFTGQAMDGAVADTDFFLLHRRPEKGLLAGMWEFPDCPGKGTEGKEVLARVLKGLGLQLAGDLRKSKPVQKIRHVFSHKVWDMEVYPVEAVMGSIPLPPEWQWVSADRMKEYNLAGPHNKIGKNFV